MTSNRSRPGSERARQQVAVPEADLPAHALAHAPAARRRLEMMVAAESAGAAERVAAVHGGRGALERAAG